MDQEAFASRYDEVIALLRGEPAPEQTMEAVATWERLRREFAAWRAPISVRFRANTTDPKAVAENRFAGEIAPVFVGRDAEIKRLLLQSPHRAWLESAVGSFTLARWESDVLAFTPSAQTYLQEESRLSDGYMQLLGSAQIALRGSVYSLSGLGTFSENRDRSLRQEAREAAWGWFASHSDELDEAFDALVATRTAMARSCGYQNYVELSYKRLGRVGYGPCEVAVFRDEIRDSIVPIAAAFAGRQAAALGLDSLMPWDEDVFDRLPGVETPVSGTAAMDTVRSVARSIHPDIGAFADLMTGAERLDIEPRDGKSAGAFCEFFHNDSMPFVFASYTGKARDCVTLLHEMGHAFQGYASRAFCTIEGITPTLEICEIHSTSLELLAAPYYDAFLGERGARFAADHIASTIQKLPYIAAVDHFQQLAYENPEATPAERREIWLQMEARYLPWKTHGGITALIRGGGWQRQHHIYIAPFYYIDYAIAICCALGLWERSLDDPKGAIESYLKLCSAGGSLPLGELLQTISLRSPFQRGVLTSVASRAGEGTSSAIRRRRGRRA